MKLMTPILKTSRKIYSLNMLHNVVHFQGTRTFSCSLQTFVYSACKLSEVQIFRGTCLHTLSVDMSISQPNLQDKTCTANYNFVSPCYDILHTDIIIALLYYTDYSSVYCLYKLPVSLHHSPPLPPRQTNLCSTMISHILFAVC